MLETISKIQPIASLAISGLTLLGFSFAAYKFSRDPDIKASQEIGLIKQRCSFLHTGVDESIGEIKGSIKAIKNNHLHHIERDIKALQEGQVKMFTILEERLPNKK